jgi:hypothetical protein
LIRKDKKNQIESNISFENKVYMPTDIAFREQATIFEEAVSDLYKNAKDNFSAHWSLIEEFKHEFFQFDLKKRKMEQLRKEMKEITKTS